MGLRQYFYDCCRVGWQSSWDSISKIAGTVVIGVLGAWLRPIHFIYDQPGFHASVNATLNFILYVIGAWFVLFLAQTLFTAPYRIWKSHKEQIKELGKVGRNDLERMMHGKYIFGETFLYTGGDIGYVCRDFKSKGDIEQLKDVFTAIPVCAPKESIAHINFQFMTNRQITDERCHFFVLKDGEPVEIENIYETQMIGLDQEGCFKLKLTWSENHKFDHASLRITVDGWTK
jgi:hypothetical protein